MLLKIQNEYHVPEAITIKHLKISVGEITTTNTITFIEGKLTLKET